MSLAQFWLGDGIKFFVSETRQNHNNHNNPKNHQNGQKGPPAASQFTKFIVRKPENLQNRLGTAHLHVLNSAGVALCTAMVRWTNGRHGPRVLADRRLLCCLSIYSAISKFPLSRWGQNMIGFLWVQGAWPKYRRILFLLKLGFVDLSKFWHADFAKKSWEWRRRVDSKKPLIQTAQNFKNTFFSFLNWVWPGGAG